MLSHVTVGANDFERSYRFYASLFETLGHRQRFLDPDAMAGWQHQDGTRPLFLLTRPFDGGPASAGNGQMIALLAADRASVDRAHATALAHGASCEGAPGLRPHYHPNYYGAYFRDPEGNKLCICCHEPEQGP